MNGGALSEVFLILFFWFRINVKNRIEHRRSKYGWQAAANSILKVALYTKM